MNATASSLVNYAAICDPSRVDRTVRSGSVAIDAKTVIADGTGGFTGRALDPGAYEFDQPLPHGGPRSQPSQRST